MKIYILICEDRHDDTEVIPFLHPIKAISKAREMARDYANTEDDYEEYDCEGCGDWIFRANYSCEGDSITVVTTELNEEKCDA